MSQQQQQERQSASADFNDDVLSYRDKFNETVTCVGIVVWEPTLMSTVVKTLHKLDNIVFLKKAFASILDVGTTLKHSNATITLGPSQRQDQQLPKGSRVVVLDPVHVPFGAIGDSTSSFSSVSSFLSHQHQSEILDALNSIVAAANSNSNNNNNNNNQNQKQDDQHVHHTIDTLFSLARVDVHLSSANYTSTEILSKLLPPGVVVPSGFEQVGHIVHLNLLPQHGPYKRLIAQVILDSAPKNTIRTVINKTESISSEFRELPFELLAGEADYNATVKQHGITFHVPYDKVYWNSRLSHEHIRLVTEAMQSGDELLDVMAGIGPFAIPAASPNLPVRLKAVYANDLNPASVDAMRKNVELNRILPKNNSNSNNKNNNNNNNSNNSNNVNRAGKIIFETFCMDGRKFITEVGRDQHLSKGRLFFRPRSPTAAVSGATASDSSNSPKIFRRHSLRHFVMNLPATAVLFLDAFVNPPLLQQEEGQQPDSHSRRWPEPLQIKTEDDVHRKFLESASEFDHTFVVHVYCFSAFSDQQQAMVDAVDQVAKVIKRPVGTFEKQSDDSSSCIVHKVHVVRDVAPNKLMICVSFSPSIMAPAHLHEAIVKEICCFSSSEGETGRRERNEL